MCVLTVINDLMYCTVHIGCNPDRYGPNCKLYCPCDKDGHGHCETGSYGCKCDPGWMGWSCNKKCPSGKYGHDCKMRLKLINWYNYLKYFCFLLVVSFLIVPVVENVQM